jgi:hypothetical protein
VRHDRLSPRRAGARILRGFGAMMLMAALALVHPVAGAAQEAEAPVRDRPVLLELYTAQGCAACPPADEMLLDLAVRDDVIALALHVDYWDYIGWADTFADPAFTQRQQRYARRHGHSTIYTPQVIVNGVEIVEGYRVMDVMDAIAAQRDRETEVALVLSRAPGGGLAIRARPLDGAMPPVAMASRRSGLIEGVQNTLVGRLEMGETAAASPPAEPEVPASAAPTLRSDDPFTVHLVRYEPEQQVEILRGENAGLMAQYANIVTEWRLIGSWDMRGPLEMTVPFEGDQPVVVLIQETGQGEIVAAARLR